MCEMRDSSSLKGGMLVDGRKLTEGMVSLDRFQPVRYVEARSGQAIRHGF